VSLKSAEALRAAGNIQKNIGYKTGLYISPHICTFRERIQINGTYIPEWRFTKYINYIWDEIGSSKLGGYGFFDISKAYITYSNINGIFIFQGTES